MGWREVRDNAPFERLEENMADQIADYMKLSGVSLREHVDLGAALALMTWLFDRPPSDRIALARELLAGTRLTINAADVGSCPFDREDHGGLSVDDPCPVCGSDGNQVPTGCTARGGSHDPL